MNRTVLENVQFMPNGTVAVLLMKESLDAEGNPVWRHPHRLVVDPEQDVEAQLNVVETHLAHEGSWGEDVRQGWALGHGPGPFPLDGGIKALVTAQAKLFREHPPVAVEVEKRKTAAAEREARAQQAIEAAKAAETAAQTAFDARVDARVREIMKERTP